MKLHSVPKSQNLNSLIFDNYLKIIKFDLFTGKYNFIKTCFDHSDRTENLCESFYEYVTRSIENGRVHKSCADILLKYFKEGYLLSLIREKKQGLHITLNGLKYRIWDIYEELALEIITDKDFSAESPYALVCVKRPYKRENGTLEKLFCGEIVKVFYRRLSDGYTEPVYMNEKESLIYESIRDNGSSVMYYELIYEDDRDEFKKFISDKNLHCIVRSGYYDILPCRRIISNKYTPVYIKITPDKNPVDGDGVFIFICKEGADGRYPSEAESAENYLLDRDIITGLKNRNAFEKLCRSYTDFGNKTFLGVLYVSLPDGGLCNICGTFAKTETLRRVSYILTELFEKNKVHRLSQNEFAVVSVGNGNENFIRYSSLTADKLFASGLEGIRAGYYLDIHGNTIENTLEKAKSNLMQAVRL